MESTATSLLTALGSIASSVDVSKSMSMLQPFLKSLDLTQTLGNQPTLHPQLALLVGGAVGLSSVAYLVVSALVPSSGSAGFSPPSLYPHAPNTLTPSPPTPTYPTPLTNRPAPPRLPPPSLAAWVVPTPHPPTLSQLPHVSPSTSWRAFCGMSLGSPCLGC